MENNKILSSVLYYLTYIIDSYPQKKKKIYSTVVKARLQQILLFQNQLVKKFDLSKVSIPVFTT